MAETELEWTPLGPNPHDDEYRDLVEQNRRAVMTALALPRRTFTEVTEEVVRQFRKAWDEQMARPAAWRTPVFDAEVEVIYLDEQPADDDRTPLAPHANRDEEFKG